MTELSLETVLYLVAMIAFTATATWFDTTKLRIPNMLIVAFFVLGLIYRTVFDGWIGLGDALLGFLVGFGLLFLVWLIGGGGGGDAKLMGALAVWMGLAQTVGLLLLSGAMVIILSVFFGTYRKMKTGLLRSKQQYAEAEREKDTRQRTRKDRSREEKVAALQKRRIMPFAIPVTIAVWLMLAAEVAGVMPTYLQKPTAAAPAE